MMNAASGAMPPPSPSGGGGGAGSPLQVIQALESKYGPAFQDIMQQLVSVGLVAMPQPSGGAMSPPMGGGGMGARQNMAGIVDALQ